MLTTRILVGHVLDKLVTLPDASVHCCVTSPPYYGLRDYGTEPQVWGGDSGCEHEWGKDQRRKQSPQRDHNPNGSFADTRGIEPFRAGMAFDVSQGSWCQRCPAWRGSLGLEPTPEQYIDHCVQIFREVRRVLRDDGTFWLNISDSYFNSNGPKPGRNDTERMYASGSGPKPGLKPKDLIGIPWMLAFALRADGWYLRKDIIWAKKAPMPESVTDRPTSSHEYIFLLAKSQRYFYDHEAVKEDAVSTHPSRNGYDRDERLSLDGRGQKEQGNDVGGKRNLRDVWMLNPAPFVGAHFATFPHEIPRRAIMAGTSEKGVCAKCGAPWERVVERESFGKERGTSASDFRALAQQPQRSNVSTVTTTIGWKPTCTCNVEVIPATVLDPFLGSGTTAVVAQQLWRSCIGIDLSDAYSKIQEKRLPEGLLYNLEMET